MNRQKIKRIYAYQYGQYWSFTKQNFIKACKGSVETGTINLDELGKEIKNQPKTVRLDGDGYPYSISSSAGVVRPLDWVKSDFEFILRQLTD